MFEARNRIALRIRKHVSIDLQSDSWIGMSELRLSDSDRNAEMREKCSVKMTEHMPAHPRNF